MKSRIQLRFFGYTSSLNFGYKLKTKNLSFWEKSLAISLEFSSGNMEKKLADDVVDYSESSVEFSIWNRTWRSASRCIVSRGTFGDNSISNNIL